MDQRRAAGALLALVVCIASTAAAPTASNQTALDLYDGSAEGCYYNFQHYGEGDRIMTNEPCLNCTCHNRMLMCYLRVCPFTKPIGQDCTVEKRADQCCPIVTCPDVPVDLLTSTSTTSPAEYGATGVGKLDKYGCSINGKYFPEGSKVPPTPNKPCEHCYCIRNMTTCVMQECTLHVDGCTPIYHKDVCCPVRYSCDHPEDTTLLLDDMTTTVRPTPGFLLTTTTLSPVTQMSQDCVHDDQIFPDGALIKTEKACEHCYCMKGDIVCVVQECGTPMENEGKNCTSQPPREGQCCPDTYICEGDEVTTEPPSYYSTQLQLEELTTISPPRRVGVEGSGYRNEPDEPAYTESPSMETEPEGSGYEQSTEPAAVDDSNLLTSETPEISSESVDDSLYSSRTTLRAPTLEEVEKTTEPDKGLNTVPSDASDEEMYKPSITEKTPFEEPKVTETNIVTSDEKEDDIEVTRTTPKDVLMPVVTTKHEESTTESDFRKEDTLDETTEIYDQSEPEKVSTQANDIEKEIEVDVTSSKPQAPFMEELERHTTLSPEYTQKDIEQGIPAKASTTESTLEVTTSVDVKPTDKFTTVSVEFSQTETTKPTVEKVEVPETTGMEQNEIEDILTTLSPGRIPGEGDCLLNDVTYRNNSNVPSSNNCHTSCKCVSSIVKCDPIICSPPPEYMDNCQPTYDSPDSCCPTYVCHTGETMPPQPHSQMSGTDSPLPSSPIECHGDECEVKKDDIIPVVGDCGSAGCGDGHSKTPEIPSEDCHDGKCSLPVQPCTDGNCQETPGAHCENGKCGIKPEILPVKDIPLCENESDCKATVPATTLCEGQECVKVDVGCSGTDCSTDVGKQPCVDGNCQETPETHCENGKCDIEPQIVPVKDIPLCENESDCKGTVPEVPSCEGEGCTTVNVECSGKDCTTDVSKQPTIPGNKEGGCEGDCKTPENETVQPCTEISCRRKESGEVDSSLPSDCSGSDCVQQVPSKEDDVIERSTKLPVTDDTGIKSTQQLEMTTESPESSTEVSGGISEHQPTETVIMATNEKSTNAPLPPQATYAPKPSEDKVLGTEPSSQFDHTTESRLDQEDTTKKSTQFVEENLSTSEPQILVTDEIRISDTDAITKEPQLMATKGQEGVDIQSPVTEYQDIITKVDSEQSLQTETTQHNLHSEPTEGPYDTELHDTRTAVPQELSTSMPETESTKTELPDHHDELSTKTPEREQTESSIPHMPDEGSVNEVTEVPLPYTPEIDITGTKLPETNVQKDATEPNATEVTNVSSHDVTESNKIDEKATKAPEPVDTDEYKLTTEIFQHELTTEGAILVTGSQEPEIITMVSEATTAKVSEDSFDVTSQTPEINITEKQESFTESPAEFTGSEELSTKQPVMPGQTTVQTETSEFTTDETIPQLEDTKAQTTSAIPVTGTEVKVTLPSDTTIIKEYTTLASPSEEKTTISEPAEKPDDHDNEKEEQPTESYDTNEVTQDISQESNETPVTPSTLEVDQHAQEPDSEVTKTDKTVTEKSDTFLTEEPSMIPVDDSKPEQITESAQEITQQQEISTDEPYISQVTDKIPSEPYIPVQPETAPESVTAQPDIINKTPDVEPATQTPAYNEYMETKIPDRSGLNEATEVSEPLEPTESPEVDAPETATEVEATQPPELFSETPTFEEIHKDEPTQSTEKPTPDTLEDYVTKVKLETEVPETFTTKMPAVDKVPEKTPGSETFVPEDQETEYVTTERIKQQSSEGDQAETSKPDKYSTVTVIQETTVASVEQQDISKQTTQAVVTERDTPLYETSAPESHVKAPQEPVTETGDTFTTESHDIHTHGVITEGPQEVSSVAPEEKPAEETPDISYDKKPGEKLELPHDTNTKTPDEMSTVFLEVVTEPLRAVISTEPTQEVIPVKPQESDTELHEEEKMPEEKSTEKPEIGETSISQLPDELFTGSSMGLDTVVTEPTQYKVTKPNADEVTSAISTNEQENITIDDTQETMTTVLQELPEQPQESSTKIPQDVTSSVSDSEMQDKYTVAVSQEATPGTLPDVVTDAPEKQETGSPLEEEGVEMYVTTLKTPQTVSATAPEQITEALEQATEEPTVQGTQEPDDSEEESITDAPLSPTQETTDDEQTMPDVVELEEHSHKPVEDISTVAPTEEEIIPNVSQEHDDKKQKPHVTTEKQTSVTEIEEEKVSIPSDEFSPEISLVTTVDRGEIPKSTPTPLNEESEQHTDVPTTSQPGIQVGDQKFSEDTSPKDHQPTQPSPISDTEIPVQTEKVLTDQESELSHKTTMLVEVISTTTKATAEEEDETSTQIPERKPLEENPIEKPQEIPEGEKPLEELTEKPMEALEKKPLEETAPIEKPTKEETKPPATPLEEPLITPVETEVPQVEDEDKPVTPLDQAEEIPTEKPEQKLPEEAEEKPTESSELKPLEEPTEPPQEKPLEGTGDDKTTERPLEESDKIPEEKPEKKPLDELERTTTEKTEEKPQELPEGEPQQVPEEKPVEKPEEKLQDVPKEKPLEFPAEKPQEVPEEKPLKASEEKPLKTPEEPEEKPEDVLETKPQEQPDEKQQGVPEEGPAVPVEKPEELPEEKPDVSEGKPQNMPEEQPQEMPVKKPEMPEEKPQKVPEQTPEMPEGKPQELPEEKPQELPEEKPQEVPEEKPEVPKEQPQEMPDEKPEDLPEEKPQELPEPEVPTEKPQVLPEEKPQEVPEEIPEQKPQEFPEEKPAEPVSTTSPEITKPGFGDVQPTDEVPDDDNQFPPSGGTSGYGTEPDYVEEDQAFGPGTCRYGGKVYVSAQQIPRDDPCDFCFCFRSDIICLQQSCPPPIHGCHEEPIQGFCCPRYECPVAMATTLNVTTTTTTTTTTLPPHFLPHAYKGAAQRRGCQIKGHTYKVGEVVRASSGPCLHCTCGGDGQMKCDPKACTPEPMLRQMIAAAVSAKRRR